MFVLTTMMLSAHLLAAILIQSDSLHNQNPYSEPTIQKLSYYHVVNLKQSDPHLPFVISL